MVGATLFQFSWDLTMDWGIVVRANSKDASEMTFLGLSMRRTRLLGKAWGDGMGGYLGLITWVGGG